jgi:riboflavin synthase
MFTGIVTDVGTVLKIIPDGEKRRLVVACAYDSATIAVGASIAVNGVCLTAVDCERAESGARVAFDVGAETLAVTTTGDLAAGGKVNLERALKIGDELGGHLVSGHVDGIAELVSRRDFDGMAHLKFRAPRELSRFNAVKGSVALDGISLTVNAVDGDQFEILLIPHTLEVTTFGALRPGSRINIEVDQMARYAARLIEASR